MGCYPREHAAMSIRRRLDRLEKLHLAVPADNADAEDRAMWDVFWTCMQEAIAPWPAALALAQKRTEANMVTWHSRALPRIKLWLMTETFWWALAEYPEARQAAERALDALVDQVAESLKG
jgi:hypothetical protein